MSTCVSLLPKDYKTIFVLYRKFLTPCKIVTVQDHYFPQNKIFDLSPDSRHLSVMEKQEQRKREEEHYAHPGLPIHNTQISKVADIFSRYQIQGRL